MSSGVLRSGTYDDLEVGDAGFELTPFDEQAAEKKVEINILVSLWAVTPQDRPVAALGLGQAAGVMMFDSARDDSSTAHVRAVWCIRTVNRSA